MSHTKEPWGHVDSRVYFPNIAGGFDLRACPNPEDNARRIVACVNACAGVGTETLELMAKHHAEPLQHSAESNLQRIAALEAKVRELEAELETERMRLAGCGVAALGYFDGCKDEYKSASLGDVLQLRDQLTASRQQVERLVEALNKWRNGRWMVLNPMKVYTAQEHCDAMRQEVVSGIDKALAAVEKERGNVEFSGGAQTPNEIAAVPPSAGMQGSASDRRER